MSDDDDGAPSSGAVCHGLFPDPPSADALCVGSGRFLRSVLVPALNDAGLRPAVVQTRGRTFLEHCLDARRKKERASAKEGEATGGKKRDADGEEKAGGSSVNGGEEEDGEPLEYEVDTVEYDGSVSTERVKCYGAGTLGTEGGRAEAMKLLEGMKSLSVIGVGVTEAGLASPPTRSMVDLTALLRRVRSLLLSGALTCPNPNGKICVVNTDNVPRNGAVVRERVLEAARREAAGGEGGGGKDGDGGGDGGDDGGNDDAAFLEFMEERVAFLDAMVDRITSQRAGSGGMVPRCEPIPAKALVIEDLGGDLPPGLGTEEVRKRRGVVVRSEAGQLDADVALKLRVANGTHTAAAQAMALCRMPMTDALAPPSDNDGGSDGEGGAVVMEYLDALFESQILPGAADDPSISCAADDVRAAWADWRRRLSHPHFGLGTFFIAQNCAAKGGIRIGPTIASLLRGGRSASVGTAFALAAVLRYLTPADGTRRCEGGAYRGWLDGSDRAEAAAKAAEASGDGDGINEGAVTYADGLRHNLSAGWYEFRCGCSVPSSSSDGGGPAAGSYVPLPERLAELSSPSSSLQPSGYRPAVRAYLTAEDGGNLGDVARDAKTRGGFESLVSAVSTLYARMVAGDGMLDLLVEMRKEEGVYKEGGLSADCSVLADGPVVRDGRRGGGGRRAGPPLFYRPSPVPEGSKLLAAGIGSNPDDVARAVFGEVAAAEVVDLHTHLLPPSHGPLCLWGIDELLTYHYLVAEYFMTAPPSVTPESFYAKTKREQADLVWTALFVDRSPVSEACRGVITTLVALGLGDAVEARDLGAVRAFYRTYRDDGEEGAERFSGRVYEKAGVRYAIMTNVPFDANEARCWRPKPKEYPAQYRSALRVDPLLAGDRKAVESALSGSGYDPTLEGARRYLRDWVDTMKPEYMMASTPHDFALPPEGGGGGGGGGVVRGNLAGVTKTGVNEEAMREPFAFAAAADPSRACAAKCDGEEDEIASVVDERSDLLGEVLMKVCEERDLPVALKIGAHRAVNPGLRQAGDGVATFADPGVLARLCARFPRVRFLATFLSRGSQHEACVLASKFRNLHLYGCWWFCNNPSLIEEITKMRVEMLGTAFTAQHSDARVLDQLLYKWPHSRAVIADVLAGEYAKLVDSGWTPTRGEVRRDVRRLFGGSYEEFMAKSLK